MAPPVRDMQMVGNFTGIGLVESSSNLVLAPNGAVDRGGNGATGNGQQPECVGVACAG